MEDKTVSLLQLHTGCLLSITDYLTPFQKIRMTAVCKELRHCLLSNDFWGKVELSDSRVPNQFTGWVKWLYNKRISPFKVQIFLSGDECHDGLSMVPSILKPDTKELTVYLQRFDEEEVDIILDLIIKGSPNIHTLITTNLPDSFPLATALPNLQRLRMMGHSDFTGAVLQQLGQLSELVIKPHELNFRIITDYIKNKGSKLQTLELDCEYYNSELFVDMIASINCATLRYLRLFHLQNMDSESFLTLRNVKKLIELTITKTYTIPSEIFEQVFKQGNWTNLKILDLSEASQITDEPLITLVNKSRNLEVVRLCWCARVSSDFVAFMIANCLNLKQLVLTGMKKLNNSAFPEIQALAPLFREDMFIKTRNSFMKSTSSKIIPPMSSFFQKNGDTECREQIFDNIKSLRNLEYLDCVSCDYVNAPVLQIISLLKPKARILDYYSNEIGLFAKDCFDYDY